jgi:SAM-dependent methyltransferase
LFESMFAPVQAMKQFWPHFRKAVQQARIDYRLQKERERLTRSGAATIESYLATHQTPKLQIGAGDHVLRDWLNSDLNPSASGTIFVDARQPLPFEDQTFDYVFSEHLIEHLTYREGLSLLRETYRILKAGGKIRVATPDVEAIIGLYSPAKNDLQKQYIAWSAQEVMGLYSPQKSELQRYFPQWAIDHKYIRQFFPNADRDCICFVVNSFFQSWGHRFLYDAATLRQTLHGAGFCQVVRCSPGKSSDRTLRGIESHGRVIGERMNEFETMVMEATRE